MNRLLQGAWRCAVSLDGGGARRICPRGRDERPHCPGADAGDRQLVHDQDLRSGPGVRPDGSMIDRAIYDTLFTYKGGDLAHRSPARRRLDRELQRGDYTFQLKKNVHFADGTPLTSADVVWSLDGSSISPATPPSCSPESGLGPREVHGRDALQDAVTQLPVILANPSTGILNSALVSSHGGSDAERGQRGQGRAVAQLSASAGAGSGPYTLGCVRTSSQITLIPSTNYWGATKSQWSSVVVRNMIAPTQLLNVARDSHEIAIDLSATRPTLKSVTTSTSPSALDLDLLPDGNNNAKVSPVTSNTDYQTGDPLRGRLLVTGRASPDRARSGSRADPLDVPRGAAPECRHQDRPRRRRRRCSPPRASPAAGHAAYPTI